VNTAVGEIDSFSAKKRLTGEIFETAETVVHLSKLGNFRQNERKTKLEEDACT